MDDSLLGSLVKGGWLEHTATYFLLPHSKEHMNDIRTAVLSLLQVVLDKSGPKPLAPLFFALAVTVCHLKETEFQVRCFLLPIMWEVKFCIYIYS